MAKIKLTQKFCNAVRHLGSKGHESYSDTELMGFYLEVRKSGGKTFSLRYQQNKKTRVHRIGDANAMMVSDARTEAKRIKSDIDLGRNLIGEKMILNATPTLQSFFEDFFLPHIKQRNRSWETSVSVFNIHILPRFGQHLMSDVSRMMVVKLHNDMVVKGLKPATANKVPIHLCTLYNLAIKWDTTGVTTNPANKFDLFPENNQVERYLNKEEANRLMIEVEKSDNKMLKYIVRFFILTGARRNEALHAKWDHFDFEAMVWTIPLSKSGKPHHVPITAALLEVLQSIPKRDDSEYIFPSKTGKPFINIYTAWNTARVRADLKDVRLHDLRHTFASTLVNAGVPLYNVQQLLGHHNISVTERYAHLSKDALVESANYAATLLSESTMEASIAA